MTPKEQFIALAQTYLQDKSGILASSLLAELMMVPDDVLPADATDLWKMVREYCDWSSKYYLPLEEVRDSPDWFDDDWVSKDW
jgi:hypothetical protein